MNNALQERQGELQQRAKLVRQRRSPVYVLQVLEHLSFLLWRLHPQLGRLDVAIREHKLELERKVESLQQKLESREKELTDVQKTITDRRMKVGTL